MVARRGKRAAGKAALAAVLEVGKAALAAAPVVARAAAAPAALRQGQVAEGVPAAGLRQVRAAVADRQAEGG
jgi:hypothetical protein